MSSKIIKSLVRVELNSNQIQALTSFINDRGVSAFQNSNLLKAINRKDFDLVPKELAKWTIDKGRISPELATLRQQEIELFTK